MNEDLEVYGGLKIEISVKCGQISEVALTTQIDVADLGPKSGAKIRDTILFLRSTIPVTEIKADDALFNKPARDVAVGADGKLTLIDISLVAARAGQEDLKKALVGDGNQHKKGV